MVCPFDFGELNGQLPLLRVGLVVFQGRFRIRVGRAVDHQSRHILAEVCQILLRWLLSSLESAFVIGGLDRL